MTSVISILETRTLGEMIPIHHARIEGLRATMELVKIETNQNIEHQAKSFQSHLEKVFEHFE